MMYYSSKARKSAIESIHDLTKKVATIPGKYLDYTDAVRLQALLEVFEYALEKEEKQFGTKEDKNGQTADNKNA